MRITQRVVRFLFPKPWTQTTPMRPEERLAQWELRKGQWRAEQALAAAQSYRVLDAYSASKAAPPIRPKLPKDRKPRGLMRKRAVASSAAPARRAKRSLSS